jgi:hypothetical protein
VASPIVAHTNSIVQHGTERRRSRFFAFVIGFLLGLLGGGTGLLFLMLTAAAHRPLVTITPSRVNPDVSISIKEDYLNQQANDTLHTTSPVVMPYVTVSQVELDLQPGNQMYLKPTFHTDFFDVGATVVNKVAIENGQLALHMQGDPQLGDIPVPISLLPFNLPAIVHDAVDRINNDVLSSEINRQLSAGFGSDQFRISDVSTSEEYITFLLNRK